MLFLQGTRDKLADLKLLKPIIKKLKDTATLHIIEGAAAGENIAYGQQTPAEVMKRYLKNS